MNRQALRDEWNSTAGGAFVLLSPAEQWSLHEYYRFTEQLGCKQLLAHRAAVSTESPSLPQRAGRAYAHLRIFTARLEYYIGKEKKSQGKAGRRRVVILSEVHARIDPEAMAHILIRFERERQRSGYRQY